MQECELSPPWRKEVVLRGKEASCTAEEFQVFLEMNFVFLRCREKWAGVASVCER